MRISTFLGLIAVFLTAGDALATNIISGNFGADDTHDGTVALTPMQSAGVVSAINWNNLNGNASAMSGLLNNNAGIATTASTSYGSANTWSNGNSGSADATMMDGFLDGNPTFTVTLVPYATYDVYVYVGQNNPSRSGTGTLSGATTGNATYYFQTDDNAGFPGFMQITQTTPPADPTMVADYQSGNYILFTGVSGSSFTYSNVSIPNQGSGQLGIHGFQIVQTPEPCAFGLAGIASIGLMVRRRAR